MVQHEFWVPGDPRPQGSMRGVVRGKRVVLISDNPHLHAWRDVVRAVALERINTPAPAETPVSLFLHFVLARGLRVKRMLPCVRPDLDKLIRAAGDALTGVAYHDDGQVCEVHASKSYVRESGRAGSEQEPGVLVTVMW